MAVGVAGNGGAISVGSDTFSVGSWTLTKRSTLGEFTHSGTSGWETHVGTKKGADLRAEIMWDSASTPESDGVDAGDAFTATLEIGDSTIKYTSVPFVCESMELTGCTQDGVVKATINAKSSGAVPDPA
jgi:hypothetical protein